VCTYQEKQIGDSAKPFYVESYASSRGNGSTAICHHKYTALSPVALVSSIHYKASLICVVLACSTLRSWCI
jgi:hypothetical protein